MILMQDIQMNVQDESDKFQVKINEKFVEGTSDYNKLKNKPKLNGNEIIGEVEEIDPTVPLWAKAEARPVYTPEDVGAMAEGSVTSVSTTELDELWNSLQEGKRIAIEYLDKSGLTVLINKIKTALNGKVDAVSGKGLSTNDYTSAEKQKLSGIASGAQANVIESVKVNGTKLTPSSKAVDVTVPTKVSQLTNDSGFQTSTQVDSIVTGKGYQTQTQVQSLINSAVGNVTSIRYEKVTSLPATGSNGVIYLVAHSHGTQDIYDEYIWIADTKTFEKIGNTDIDLSAYVKSSELTAITTNDLNIMWGQRMAFVFKDRASIQWLVSKIKSVTTSHNALNQMVMNNHFTTNLNATSAQDLVDEKGNTILADWSYEVASGEVGTDWTYKVKEE